MKKITTSIILLLFCTLSSQGQIDTDTIYHSDTIINRSYKKDGKINVESYFFKDTIVKYKFYHYYKEYYVCDYYADVKKTGINNPHVTLFYLNGKIKSKYKSTRKGYIQGSYKTFYPNGNPECDCYYKDGLRDSIQNYHYESGKINSIGTYKKNKREGETSFYYENGQLKKEVIYKNGIPWEILSYFDIKGKPLEKGTLKDGTGTYYFYDDKGKRENIELYKSGKLKKKNYFPPNTDS